MAGYDFQAKRYRRDVLKPLLNGEDVDDLAIAAVPLEPAADDDVVVAEHLRALQGFLAKEQANPRYGGVASTARKRLDALKPALLDPGRRAALRRQAAQIRAAADGERFAKLDAHIEEFVRRFGGVPADRVPRLKALLADELSAEEIDERLQGRVIGDDSSGSDAPAVSATVRRLVRERLRRYESLIAAEGRSGSQPGGPRRAVRTLYDFLELPPGVPAGDIARRRDQIELRNRQRRHDRLRTVTDELLSYTTQLLVEPGPAAYQQVIAADAVEALKPEVERIVLFDDRVSAAEFERLLRETVELGLPGDVARAVVTSTATDLGVPVETGAVVEYATCQDCGSAQPLDDERQSCSRCGASLYEPCTRCRNRNPVSAARCGHCGFDLMGLARARRAVAEAAEALDAGRAAEALVLVEGSEDLDADVPGLAGLRQRARDRMAEAQMTWARLSRALEDGSTAEAASLLDHLRQRAADTTGPDGLSLDAAAEQLERAASAVTTALGELEGIDERARERRLLELVGEHGEVPALLDALAAVELQPAADVKAEPRQDGVAVRWTPSPSPGAVLYEVIREPMAPGAPAGRTTVGRTSQPTLLDGRPPQGQPLRYLVVATRHGVSAAEAVGDELSLTPEVSDLRTSVHDGAVQLEWTPPRDAAAVEARRSTAGADEAAARTIRAGMTGALDTDVVDGVTYRYQVQVRYRPPVGPTVRSDGAVIEASVVAPPEPPRLELRSMTTHVALSVVPPEDAAPGETVVLRSDGPPAVAVGALLGAAELEQVGRRVIAAGPDPTDGLPGPPRWYVPAMAVGERFVVGAPVAHPGCGPVSDVRAVQEGADLRLRWRWPVGATRAQALIGPAPDPQPFGPGVIAASCTNTRYDIDDGLVVRGLQPGTHYICVIPQAQAGNDRVPLPDPREDSCTTYEHL